MNDAALAPYGILEHLNQYTELIATPFGIQAWMTEDAPAKANRNCPICKKNTKGKVFYIPIAQKNFVNRKDRICKECIDTLRQALDDHIAAQREQDQNAGQEKG